MIKKFNKNITISVIGLGYVGLPLALEFSNFFKVVGVDSKKKRIIQLKKKFKKLKIKLLKILQNSLWTTPR